MADLRRGAASVLNKVEWHRLVLDEGKYASQVYIPNDWNSVPQAELPQLISYATMQQNNIVRSTAFKHKSVGACQGRQFKIIWTIWALLSNS